jgi:hypothetical protein
MNATLEQAIEEDGSFLDLVDFKWLMTGLGLRVDLSRLQRDMAYARDCMQFGLASDSNLLRQRSVELLCLFARLDAQRAG